MRVVEQQQKDRIPAQEIMIFIVQYSTKFHLLLKKLKKCHAFMEYKYEFHVRYCYGCSRANFRPIFSRISAVISDYSHY